MGRIEQSRYLYYINEWLTELTKWTGYKHTYKCEFNDYTLYVEKNNSLVTASTSYNGSKAFCDFVNELWIYYSVIYKGV